MSTVASPLQKIAYLTIVRRHLSNSSIHTMIRGHGVQRKICKSGLASTPAIGHTGRGLPVADILSCTIHTTVTEWDPTFKSNQRFDNDDNDM